MSTKVRCRIYNGLCPTARRNVLFSAEGDYTPKRFSFLRYIVCPCIRRDKPELDCLAVAAEIAEIMQIGPQKIKRHNENISPREKGKTIQPSPNSIRYSPSKQRVLTKEIVDFQPDIAVFERQRYLNVARTFVFYTLRLF